MKILVTGGTGFLGKAVVDKLKKHKVTVFARKKGRGRFVAGDVTDIAALKKAFPADVVVHLAACIDGDKKEMQSVNVEGTKNVVTLCRAYGVKQLIFMSSTAVFGNDKILTEDTERKPKTDYGKTKKDAEDVVMNSGLNYTIIRAPVIIGANDAFLSIIKAANKNFPLIGNGNNHFHAVYVDDVALLIAKVVGNKRSYGNVFHIATNDKPTYREFYYYISKALGIKMTKKSIPVTAVKTASILYEAGCKLRRKKPKTTLSRQNINRLTRERIIVIDKSRRLIGFTPKYNTERAINETVNQFKKLGKI